MKKHLFYLIPLILLSSPNTFAQDTLLKQSTALITLQNPVAKKYAMLINPQDAKKHLSVLASDEFGGRETGTAEAEMAANYIAGEFKKLELVPPVNGTYFQKLPLVETKLEVKSFVVNGIPFKNGKDFYYTQDSYLKGIQAKEVVFLGDGTEHNLNKAIDLENKVVLMINKGEPFKKIPDNIAAFLKNKKPALILMVNQQVSTFLQEHSTDLITSVLTIQKVPSSDSEAYVSVVNITPELANQILKPSHNSYEGLKREVAKSSFKPLVIKANISIDGRVSKRNLNAKNVLGYLEGTDLKDELVVISAHYDHIGIHGQGEDKIHNGADDDASGTTAVLELACAYAQAKKDGKGPRRSILFLGNVGEEKGLLGSEWYSDHPVFPLTQTITNLNIDMIGRVDPQHKADTNYCYLIGSDKLSTDLHKISENANSTYTKLKIDYKYNDPNDPEQFYYRSDHYNFVKHNIPVIFYFNGVHEDYHKPSDEIDKINFNLLTKRAQLVFYTAWELLNRDKRPVVDVVNNMPPK